MAGAREDERGLGVVPFVEGTVLPEGDISMGGGIEGEIEARRRFGEGGCNGGDSVPNVPSSANARAFPA